MRNLIYFFGVATIGLAQQPNVTDIIAKSVEANQADFKAAPNFNYKERDRTPKGSKTYQVTMIEGTPYSRLIEVNGKPLSAAQQAQEQKKQQQTTQQRRSESPQQRQQRIAKFQRDLQRNNSMIDQLTKAFAFKLVGQTNLRGFDVWMIKGTPKPGYKPINRDTEVLPGMLGELWIDQKTYQWVKVTARVVHPVSIEGFLAEVEPGTQFELENSPVPGGTWQATHFSMKSNARVLHLFKRASSEDDTYFDYQTISGASQ